MKILVVGAGVIGTIFGGRLALAGHEVTMLARGQRLAQIVSQGLVLEDALTGCRQKIPVAAMPALPAEKLFDLVVVTARDRQLPGLLPALDALQNRPRLLFMLNCPLRVAELVARYGEDRALFGFPGAGGVHADGHVRFAVTSEQPTTFGPVAGQSAGSPHEAAALFRRAGFSTALVADMEAWLKTHAFLVVAICGTLYASGGRSAQLAADASRLHLLVAGLREGLSCLRALGLTPSPLKLRLMARLPMPILLLALRRFLSSDLAALVIDGHANAAPDDMRDLAADCRSMIAEADLPAPTMLSLCGEVERRAALDQAA